MLAANGELGGLTEVLPKKGTCVSGQLCPTYTSGTRLKVASTLQHFSPKEKRKVQPRHIRYLLYSTADCGDLAGPTIPLNRSIMSITCAHGMSVWLRPASRHSGLPEFIGSSEDEQPARGQEVQADCCYNTSMVC